MLRHLVNLFLPSGNRLWRFGQLADITRLVSGATTVGLTAAFIAYFNPSYAHASYAHQSNATVSGMTVTDKTVTNANATDTNTDAHFRVDFKDYRLGANLIASNAAPQLTEANESSQIEDPKASLSPAQIRLRGNIVTFGTLGIYAAYGFSTWWNDANSDFNQQDEDWFNENSYSGGADKLGHMFSTYISTRLLTRGYQWAGLNHQHALRRARNLAFFTLTAVEIMDGFTKEYGFSWEDFIMNTLGIGMAQILESDPDMDALWDFRVLYRYSDDADRKNSIDPFSDYSGQIYLFVLRPAVLANAAANSNWHLLEIAAGYGTKGYRPLTDLNTPKERNLYLGVSLNVTELLHRYWYKETPRQPSALTEALKYLQVPGTAALMRKNLNE